MSSQVKSLVDRINLAYPGSVRYREMKQGELSTPERLALWTVADVDPRAASSKPRRTSLRIVGRWPSLRISGLDHSCLEPVDIRQGATERVVLESLAGRSSAFELCRVDPEESR